MKAGVKVEFLIGQTSCAEVVPNNVQRMGIIIPMGPIQN